MKKIKKILTLCLISSLCVLSLTACGNINIEKLYDKWTVSTIDGKSPEKYAEEFGSKASKAVDNIELKDGKKMTVTNVNGTKEYNVEAGSNGFQAVDYDKVIQSYFYDKDSDTFYANVDFGKGSVKVLYKRGTTDLKKLVEKEERAAESSKKKEDSEKESKKKDKK